MYNARSSFHVLLKDLEACAICLCANITICILAFPMSMIFWNYELIFLGCVYWFWRKRCTWIRKKVSSVVCLWLSRTYNRVGGSQSLVSLVCRWVLGYFTVSYTNVSRLFYRKLFIIFLGVGGFQIASVLGIMCCANITWFVFSLILYLFWEGNSYVDLCLDYRTPLVAEARYTFILCYI